MSIFLISAFFSWSMCSGESLLARSPAKIAGCRVFTRPSIISGKPVTSEIPTVLIPLVSRRGGAAGGDDLHAQLLQPLAKSTMPSLSETLMIARSILTKFLPPNIRRAN